jgi:hypothetical protein
MYTNFSYELAAAKQRDMLAQGAKERRARQARQLATAPPPSASRRSPRASRLVQLLRPQAQS